ncbi:uncharacterized protein LOC126828376 [Patella vulgata]|uniref:uncharacterized protein LOC126828376 n=1 Tax=Patella vulgata TaxID=6465 RepID=UPI0024A9E7A2|nr:uncharacterized protein LOC126828376 [Patella vulgata]
MMDDFRKSQTENIEQLKKNQQEFFNYYFDKEDEISSHCSSHYDEQDESDEENVNNTEVVDGTTALQQLLVSGSGKKEPPRSHSGQSEQEVSNPVCLTNYFSQYNNIDEVCGPNIEASLAEAVNNMIKHGLSEEKTNELLNRYTRPQNCQNLTQTKVNPPIWESLSGETRSTDIKLQKIQNIIMKAFIPLTKLAELLMTSTGGATAIDTVNVNKHGHQFLTDSMALLAAVNAEVNGRRRVLMKTDVNTNYRSLCTIKGPNGALLFGADLTDRLREISETNRVVQKVNRDRSSYSRESTRYSPYNKMEAKNRRYAYKSNSRNYGRPGGNRFLDKRSVPPPKRRKIHVPGLNKPKV